MPARAAGTFTKIISCAASSRKRDMGPGEPPQRMREYATRPNCKFLSVCPQKGFSVCLVAVPLTYSRGASREESRLLRSLHRRPDLGDQSRCPERYRRSLPPTSGPRKLQQNAARGLIKMQHLITVSPFDNFVFFYHSVDSDFHLITLICFAIRFQTHQ